MYITIDGGTSNTRIYSVEQGHVKPLAKAAVGAHNPNKLRIFLKEELARLRKNDVAAIIASGMITGCSGIYDLDHINAPAGLHELHNAVQKATITDITSVPLTFIPGIKINSPQIENADIMRGEETELMGLGEISANTAYVLPGTHSKCIMTDEYGRICNFFTMMTGEMLYAIKQSTIIGSSFEYFNSADEKFLSEGFELAAKKGINEALFKCRIMDMLYSKNQKEIYSFCLGVILFGELDRIAKTNAKTFVFGGREALRVPESFLFKKYYKKNTISLDSDICSKAAALGAVKIYECKTRII